MCMTSFVLKMTYDGNAMIVNVCGVEERCGCKILFQISV